MASPCSFTKINGPIMPLDQNPHQTVTRFGCGCFSMHACGGFLCPKCVYFACSHIRQDQNELHLKKLFFFFAKIGIFCKSITGPLSEAYTNVYKPYSFGGSIKLIICQIRHELSFTIHDISTSWKKNVRCRTLYNTASGNNNLTLKVTGRMIFPSAYSSLLSYWVLIIMRNNLSAR